MEDWKDVKKGLSSLLVIVELSKLSSTEESLAGEESKNNSGTFRMFLHV